MSRDADLIMALNKAGPALSIHRERAEELAVELKQLQAAALAARRRVEFNTDPGDFRDALEETAGERR